MNDNYIEHNFVVDEINYRLRIFSDNSFWVGQYDEYYTVNYARAQFMGRIVDGKIDWENMELDRNISKDLKVKSMCERYVNLMVFS